MKFVVASILLVSALVSVSEAKIFGQCEFANTIRGYGIPGTISTWVCIASHESNFNTDATNTVTGDHGIFQISQIYWCTASGAAGNGCNIQCSALHNDDISDDTACAATVYNEFVRTRGDGFAGWTTYQYCQGDTSSWTAGC